LPPKFINSVIILAQPAPTSASQYSVPVTSPVTLPSTRDSCTTPLPVGPPSACRPLPKSALPLLIFTSCLTTPGASEVLASDTCWISPNVDVAVATDALLLIVCAAPLLGVVVVAFEDVVVPETG